MQKAKRVESHAKERVKDLRHKALAKNKKLEKLIGSDEVRRLNERTESLVKEGIKEIERVFAAKEREIMNA